MASQKERSKAEIARRALAGDSDDDVSSGDELGLKQNDWEWVYDVADDYAKDGEGTSSNARKRRLSAKLQSMRPGRIIGVKLGKFECCIGDPVVLRAGRNETWVAIIYEFIDDAAEDDKMAKFMWFSVPSEIRNKSKRRTDALDVRRGRIIHRPGLITTRMKSTLPHNSTRTAWTPSKIML